MKNWPAKGIAFFLYCVIHAVFLIVFLPMFPDTLLMGWLPLKIAIYIVALLISSVVNTIYMDWFLGTQPDF